MLHVRWTTPRSVEAWEWIPDEALVCVGNLTGPDDAQTLEVHESWAPAWTSLEKRQQCMVDTTALFAQEANLLPTNVCIYWIGDRAAVSWTRSTGVLRHHPVTAGRLPTVHSPDAELGSTNDLRSADRSACETLGVAA
jgi:hypothetical protein